MRQSQPWVLDCWLPQQRSSTPRRADCNASRSNALISWIAIIAMSAGLFAPRNGTVIVTLMLAALSVAGAIFLTLELDMPFDGVIQISQKPMYNALIHLGH